MTRRRIGYGSPRSAAAVRTALALLGLCAVGGGTLRAAAAQPPSFEWPAHGGQHADWYYSPLEQINAGNVSRLGPAWSFDLDTRRGQEATPIEVNGVLYVTTAWSKVYALDARTGQERWHFDPHVPGPAGYKSCCDVVNRGPAVDGGRVYVATTDGRLIALDADKGRLLWSVPTVDENQMYAVTGAPRAFRGKILIGNNGGETGSRGYVSAYDAKNGHLLWRFYTVPRATPSAADHAASDQVLESVARPTWHGAPFTADGGGHVWNAIAVDEELHQVYIGTGNPFPWNPKYRADPGSDCLFTDSIIALDADTGAYRWHYQEVPGDAWDFDATEDMVLTQATYDNERLPVLMQAAKNGFFYVINRRTGRLLSAQPFVEGVRWTDAIDLQSGRPHTASDATYPDHPFLGSPGPGGAHSWRPTAFNPATGLVYIPASQNAYRYVGVDRYEFTSGVDDIGVLQGGPLLEAKVAGQAPAPPPREALVAWDPYRQAARWQVETTGGGGVLSTAGNLVLQGEHRLNTAGQISAYRADTGERLWRHAVPNALLAGPITYRAGAAQFVVTVAGAGGSADLIPGGSNQTLQPSVGRVLAFRLDGNYTLPADPAPAVPIRTVVDTWPASSVQDGGALYARLCSRCHSREARSHNVVPDLRRSAALLDGSLWHAIVIDGALSANGMISWKKFVTDDQADMIRGYVSEQARKALR